MHEYLFMLWMHTCLGLMLIASHVSLIRCIRGICRQSTSTHSKSIMSTSYSGEYSSLGGGGGCIRGTRAFAGSLLLHILSLL